ncbi:hypothetical protein BG000_008012, partial [Podila horticola]
NVEQQEHDDESDEEDDDDGEGVNGAYSEDTKALLNGSSGARDPMDSEQAPDAGVNKKRHQRGRRGKPAQSRPQA